MSQLPILCLKMQIQTFALQCEGLKEYEADWLKNAKTITRDASGRFASKASEVGKDVGQIAEITSDTIKNLVKDKAFRERAGLAAGMVGAELIKNLSKNPQISAKLDQIIAENSAKLAEQYGDDKDPFAQALRKARLPELPKDASFTEKMEYNIARYKALEDALENPDKYSKKEELVAKTMKAAVPVAASLALAVAPEVAIGLLMGEGLTTILAGSAAGLATSFAANKAMDAAKIDNPAARLGIELAVGVATGAIVTGAAKKIASLKKVAKEAEAWRGVTKERKPISKYQLANRNKVASNIGVQWDEIQGVLDDLKNLKSANVFDILQSKNGDGILDVIVKQKGFDKKPNILSQGQMDDLLTKGEHLEAFRGIGSSTGISSEEMSEQLKRGVFYQGYGLYGNGTYVAVVDDATKEMSKLTFSIAKGYAQSNMMGGDLTGLIFRIALPKNAKMIEHRILEQKRSKLSDLLSKKKALSDDKALGDLMGLSEEDATFLKHLIGDNGRIAALLGFDGIKVQSSGSDYPSYAIILNRAIMTIQENDFIIKF